LAQHLETLELAAAALAAPLLRLEQTALQTPGEGLAEAAAVRQRLATTAAAALLCCYSMRHLASRSVLALPIRLPQAQAARIASSQSRRAPTR